MYADYGYEPTTEDLQDWSNHIMALEMEDFSDNYGPTDEELINWNEANDYTNEADEEDDDVDPGEMDGDHTSALASAGHGTDEDYGYYGDNDY